MDDVVVARITQVDLVPVVLGHEVLPPFLGDEGGCVHGTSIADDQTISGATFSQLEKSVLDLHHGLQKVLLELDGWK